MQASVWHSHKKRAEWGLTWQEIQLVNDKTGSHTQPTSLLVVEVKVFLGPSQVMVWEVKE